MTTAPALESGMAPDLAPIGLEELVERAQLLTRVDRKYVVPRATLADLVASVPASARVLEIAGARSFGYRSTYLDTDDFDSYYRAGRRRRRRFKVRTRAYLDTRTCWLEVKTRAGRGVTVKQRIAHPDAELAGLTAAGRDFVDQELAAGRICGVSAARLRPVLVTAYQRTTLFLPESASRATIDVDLGWTSLGRRGHGDLDRPALAVVETKTGSTPSALDRLLWARGARPARISKYGVGMAALHTDLPDLKWHRVLRRDLAITNHHHRSTS